MSNINIEKLFNQDPVKSVTLQAVEMVIYAKYSHQKTYSEITEKEDKKQEPTNPFKDIE